MPVPTSKLELSHPDHYLDLWKWFTDDAARIKDRMWTMASFFYTLLGALLGFAANKLSSGAAGDRILQVRDPILVGAVAVIGCLLSAYAMFMIREYGYHIRSGWNRADYIRFRLEGLSEIWCYDDPRNLEQDEILKRETSKKLPRIARRLIVLLGLFLTVFAGILLLTITLIIE